MLCLLPMHGATTSARARCMRNSEKYTAIYLHSLEWGFSRSTGDLLFCSSRSEWHVIRARDWVMNDQHMNFQERDIFKVITWLNSEHTETEIIRNSNEVSRSCSWIKKIPSIWCAIRVVLLARRNSEALSIWASLEVLTDDKSDEDSIYFVSLSVFGSHKVLHAPNADVPSNASFTINSHASLHLFKILLRFQLHTSANDSDATRTVNGTVLKKSQSNAVL